MLVVICTIQILSILGERLEGPEGVFVVIVILLGVGVGTVMLVVGGGGDR